MSLAVWLPLNGDLHNQGLRQNLNIIGTNITFSNNGKIGECADFNGTSSRIYIPNFSIDNQWSYGCWVNTPTSDTRGWESVIILNNSGSDADSQLAFWIHQKENRIESLANTKYTSTIPYTPYYNSWHHFFATYNGAVLTSYIDGIIVKTQTITNEKYTGTNLTIGARCTAVNGSSFSSFFQGSLNDVRIYDHCLSQKEVEEISNGLVLHYKLNDQFLESTTNLITTEDGLSNTCYNGATSKYNYGTNTDIYKTVGTFQRKFCTKVYMGTAGKSAYPYIYFDPFNAKGTEIQTVSFDYFPTIQDTLIAYSYNGTYNFSYTSNYSNKESNINASQIIIPVNVNQWNHITITAQKYDTTNTNRGIGYVRIGSTAHTSTTTDYWLFANIQVENKDHATGYAGVAGIRNNNMVYDSSGYNNNGIIVDGTITSPSPKYLIATSLKGTTVDNSSNTLTGAQYILVPLLLSPISALSVCWWAKINKYARGGILESTAGTNLLSSDYNTTAIANWDSTFRIYNGSSSINFFSSFSKDAQWHHRAIIFDGSKAYYYEDGVLKQSGALTGTLPAITGFKIGVGYAGGVYRQIDQDISDFRIYTTALTEMQIEKLYKTSMLIDSSGKIKPRDLE